MGNGFGPDCPKCGRSSEWTQREIDEVIYAPRTYCCNFCYEFYVLDIEEIAEKQRRAQALISQSDAAKSETEEDWKKAREDWDKED